MYLMIHIDSNTLYKYKFENNLFNKIFIKFI